MWLIKWTISVVYEIIFQVFAVPNPGQVLLWDTKSLFTRTFKAMLTPQVDSVTSRGKDFLYDVWQVTLSLYISVPLQAPSCSPYLAMSWCLI